MIIAAYFTFILTYQFCFGVELTAHLSENGLHGFVAFTEESGNVYISVKLDTESSWKWSVRELPIDYSQLENRCNERHLGPRILDLTQIFGEVSNATQSFTSRIDELPLTGKNGIWSRSLVLESSSSGQRACASIAASGNSSVKVAQANFAGENGIAGKILLRWFGSSSASDAVFYTDLFYTERRPKMEHSWRIYTTDILESEADKAKENCNSLQVILMDLTTRVGRVKVGERTIIRDPGLPHADIGNPKRIHYIVIMDSAHPETYLTCARIIPTHPTFLKAVISARGVSGCINLQQESILSPTRVFLNVTKVNEPVLGGFRIHSLPAMPPLDNSVKLDRCKEIGEVYNPLKKGVGAEAPIPAEQSQDNYALGDLSGKLGYAGEREWDVFLPLIGKYSVAHRSLVIYRNGESGIEEPWVCVTLTRYKANQPEYKMPVITAEAVFRYPLVGKVIFQQPDPHGETTVLVERLVHADGTSLNTTRDHRWGITLNPPGKDFFNWTARCVSAGPTFNPFKVNPNKSTEYITGDLTRLGLLVVSGSKKIQKESRFLFTDDHLPLTGQNTILGKSLVIYDDFGPKARGERLACSKITGVFRRKAVARDWFGNGLPASVSGKIEFYQQTQYGVTDIDVNLEGLQDINSFQVHMTPVLEILEFPCEPNTLYDVYNPYNAPAAIHGGTPDQIRVGDLSGKFGSLSGHMSVKELAYNDTNLMLFGQTSILGRSIVLHTKTNNKRYACSTIERGYAPSEARELRAIASFHHPLGFAYGYIRMTQLIHSDGSASETIIEVNLRHPGKHDRNMTYNHNWAIWVNPVGVDATVKVLNTRCTAAGYVWNPYYTQLADPLNEDLYRQECGPDMPLRCYVGDLSGRLGTINLGVERKVFTDANFPLEGKISAMGRSIVIFEKEKGHFKYACANIQPDYNTVKYVNVRRPPKFVVSQFLEDVRNIMGIPEWYLTIDSRKTKILYNGACVQLLIHFKGPDANKLEQDFSRLLSTGKLSSPSLYIPGYTYPQKRVTTIAHKLCSSTSPAEKKYPRFSTSSSIFVKPFYVLIFFTVLL